MNDMLDVKDRKILFELEQNSRQSLNQIARKVGLRKETVFYRMKKLEEDGIIKKYLTEIDVYKLGYQYYPLLLRFQNSTPEIEQEILDYLRRSKYIAWLTTCEGAWDVNATLVASGNFALKAFAADFLEKYGEHISDKQFFITTEIHYFKRGFWLNRKTNEQVTTGGEYLAKSDTTDLMLLKLLSTNARMPLVDIGAAFKTDAKNIAYRIKKLEKQKIIQGSRVLVDFSKLGYKYHKVWLSLRNINKDNYKKMLAYFSDQPNIIWATRLIGCYDVSCEMEVRNTEEFRAVVSDIKAKFHHLIKKHESLLIFEETVMNYLPNV